MKSPHPRKKRSRGFTLAEILIVVAIIALLGALAVPAALRAYKTAVASKAAAHLKAFEDAIIKFHAETNRLPLIGDPAAGGLSTDFPVELEGMIRQQNQTFSNTVIGGNFFYDVVGNRPMVGFANVTADPQVLQRIDEVIDDDNLATGIVTYNGTDLIYMVDS